MLVSLYFEPLKPDFERIVAARDQLGEHFANIVVSPGATKNPSIEDLSMAYRAVRDTCDAFLLHASPLSRAYL